MQIIESILTQNDCYKAGRKITVKGLMLHSIGTPQPDPMVFVRNWNKPGIEKCVHGFIGKDGRVYQTLPWNHRGWHAGGPANNTHIGVEMCEPKTITYISGSNFTDSDPVASKAFVVNVYNTAVELYAFLCKQYNLNPLTQIISHAEGYRLGVASNHGDPEHLWRHYGLTMAQFRKDVAAKMGNVVISIPIPSTGTTYPVAYIGQKGTNVKILQTNLAKLGYSLTIDSSYGPTTTNIVKTFQAKVGITADGQAGAQTQSYIKQEIEKMDYINSVLVKYGDTGEKVRALQTNLVTLNYLKFSDIDGSFGVVTREAVKKFQSDKGLEVDGYAGPATQDRIKAEIAKLVVITPLYRVRKSWADSESQIGAYANLDSAKELANKNPGYYVFDEAGVALYTKPVEVVPEPTPIEPTPSPDPIEPSPEPVEPEPIEPEPTPIEPAPIISKEQKTKELKEYLSGELDTLVQTIVNRWM